MATLNPMDLGGRTVLVTGASSGIGRQTALLLSRLGARVVLVARHEGRLGETLGLLEGTGHVVRPLDLRDVDALPRWMKEVAAEVGPLHGLVHSAGVHQAKPLRVLNLADVEGLMRVNVGAAVGLARGFRQKGVCAPGGSLVFLSSVMGFVGQPAVAAYAASKGALVALARSLAVELAGEGLRVNCVAPGMVRTEMSEQLEATLGDDPFEAVRRMHPLGLGTPQDVAHAIAFLLADTGRWITGSTLVVDGGYTAH